MADPLGLIGVVGVATQIIQLSVQFGLDWKDAPTDARSFANELHALKNVLSETNTNIVLNPDFIHAFHGRHSTILSQLGDTSRETDTQVLLSSCRAELESLLEKLKKRAEGHRMGWERLKGAFLATRTREAVQDLLRQCQALNSMLAIDAVALTAGTHREVRELAAEQRKWHDTTIKRRQHQADSKVLNWLTPIDYAPQQLDFLRRRQEGTGQWLLDSTKFKSWADAIGKTLFCPGIPGAGKTILTSIVIDNLTTRFEDDESVGIAYIYCNFRRQGEQKAEDLLTNLLKQLAQGQPSLPGGVQSLYNRHQGKRTPPFDEISSALHSVACLYSKVFIIVDALDECQASDRQRSRFLSEIFAIQAKYQANIFATSRHIPDITSEFSHSMIIEIRATDADVQRYLEGHLAQLPSFVGRNRQLQDMIKMKISKAADGMFLLAQIYLDSLEDKLTPKAMKMALERFQQNQSSSEDQQLEILSRAYEEVMGRINEQKRGFRDLAQRVLFWITYATRPLTTSELQDALAIEEWEPELDRENISLVADMISVCAGLVTLDDETGIIRLVHYTTQQYFQRTRGKWFPNAETEMTVQCVTYLSFSVFDSGPCPTDAEFEERLKSYPFYDYAAHNWGNHARQANIFFQEILDLLQCDPKREASVQALMSPNDGNGSRSQKFPGHLTGLHLAAYFGIQDAVRRLLDRHGPDITDSYDQTPLLLASKNAQEAIVRLLLDAGADAGANDNDGRTPLHWAALNGDDATTELLLSTGKVDAGSKLFNSGRTPLILAAERGHEAVVKLLLTMGTIGIESKEYYRSQTPLALAVSNEHIAVVKLLLENGADMSSKNLFGESPLLLAAKNGHEAIVGLLLSRGADADAQDERGWTPLSRAAERGSEPIVKLLLATGKVDINLGVKGPYDGCVERTPLSLAAQKGYDAIVELLLEVSKRDDDIKDSRCYETPLALAASSGHDAIVRLLLATGVNANIHSDHGKTPLGLAIQNGHDAVVELLLEIGKADIDMKDSRYGDTPLVYAADNGRETIVKRLLTTGVADVNSRNEYGWTALIWAAYKGHDNIVKQLLERGGDSNAKNKFGNTPLSVAAKGCHEATVRLLLLEKDIDIDAMDNGGRTPLSLASEEGNETIVRLLLEMGADVNARDELGQTPLNWAIRRGHEAITRLLLAEETIDVDVKDSRWGETPLSWAAKSGDEAVFELLLSTKKVNVNARTHNGETPLHLAASNGHEVIVKLLLETEMVDVDAKDFETGHAPPHIDKMQRRNDYGMTPLSRAAASGHEAIVKLLIETGKVDVDSKSTTYGHTPLSLAAKMGHESIVKLLLATKKVDVDSNCTGPSAGETPLILAVKGGHEAVVRLLLETRKVNVNSKTTSYPPGRTPLTIAAENGYEAIVKLLLATEQVDVDILAGGVGGLTPLSLAAKEGHEAIVKLLLASKKVNIDSKGTGIYAGETPLILASFYGHEGIVKELLGTGKVDVNLKDPRYGRTPLHWAANSWKHSSASARSDAIVKMLLQSGADVEAKDNDGQTPLRTAAVALDVGTLKLLLPTAKSGHVDIKDSKKGRTPLSWVAGKNSWSAQAHRSGAVIKLLLGTGEVDINSRDSRRGRTPLSWAAGGGNDNSVKLLLATGKADIDSRDDQGCTPLCYAAINGHEAVIERLLEKGAEADARDNGRRTPLSYAAASGCDAVVEQLLSKGSKFDERDNTGQTPLFYAASAGNEAVVKQLLKNGAEVDARDNCGRTPFDLASFRFYDSVEDHLIRYGAAVPDDGYGLRKLFES